MSMLASMTVVLWLIVALTTLFLLLLLSLSTRRKHRAATVRHDIPEETENQGVKSLDIPKHFLLFKGRGPATDQNATTTRLGGSAVGLGFGTAKATGTRVGRVITGTPEDNKTEHQQPNQESIVTRCVQRFNPTWAKARPVNKT